MQWIILLCWIQDLYCQEFLSRLFHWHVEDCPSCLSGILLFWNGHEDCPSRHLLFITCWKWYPFSVVEWLLCDPKLHLKTTFQHPVYQKRGLTTDKVWYIFLLILQRDVLIGVKVPPFSSLIYTLAEIIALLRAHLFSQSFLLSCGVKLHTDCKTWMSTCLCAT